MTSIGHRETLCEIYGLPPDGLFAHQDQGLAVGAAPRLVAGFPELQQAMLATVTGARQCLVALGSRSRDARYLEAIEEVLGQRPALVCYRVLFGPPRHQALKDHLSRLVEPRNPADRSLGVKTLHIGMVEDTDSSPERFFCASEEMAVGADSVADLSRGVRQRGCVWPGRGGPAGRSRPAGIRGSLPSTRRAVADKRLAQINHAAATTGDDPELDTLLLRLHTEIACRRGGRASAAMTGTSEHGIGWSDLDAARLLLDKLGVKPADLMAAPARAEVPLIADYIPLVEQAVTNGTRRVYGPYWARVVRE